MQEKLSWERGNKTITSGERERVDFGALSILLLALEQLQLLSHPLVRVAAQQLQDVLVQRLQGSCDSFTFQQLKRLMLLLAKLAPTRVPPPEARTLEAGELRAEQRVSGAAGVSAGGASHVPTDSVDRQKGCPGDWTETHEDSGVLRNRSFLIEVMRAAADRAAVTTTAAEKAKESICDEREMFAVAWCIAKFDRMIFGRGATQERNRDFDAATMQGEDRSTVKTTASRGLPNEKEDRFSRLGTLGDHEEPDGDDGYSYQDPRGDRGISSDELTDEMLEVYVQSRERLLESATRGVRSTIVSRLRCSLLDGAMVRAVAKQIWWSTRRLCSNLCMENMIAQEELLLMHTAGFHPCLLGLHGPAGNKKAPRWFSCTETGKTSSAQ